MRVYSDEAENNIHARQQVDAWARSGFLTADQKQSLERILPVNLRQTNLFFRSLLFLFTLVCLGAVVGLCYWVFRPSESIAMAGLLFTCAIPCYVLAEILASQARLYRYGIEEGLAFAATVMMGVGFGMVLNKTDLLSSQEIMGTAAFVALILFWMYTRFGWMYAAYGSVLAVLVIPFELHIPEVYTRLIVALILFVIFFFTYVFSMHSRPDFQRSRNQVLQASLLFGIYLAINLQIGSLPFFRSEWHLSNNASIHASFPTVYWLTYLLCWSYSLLLIYWGFKRRRRVLLDVGLLTFAITLATNKDYLGLIHKSWDLIPFGIFLIAVALFTHHILKNKERAERWKLTNKNILKPKNHGFDLMAAGAFMSAPAINHPGASTHLGGGDSGGAGASRGF